MIALLFKAHHHLFKNKLKRQLSLPTLTLIGIGSTIEASIFMLISPAAAIAGVYLPLAYLVGGLIVIAIALVYAEIATSMPYEGADLHFIYKAFTSRRLSFVIAWMIILGDLSYLALNAIGFGSYLNILKIDYTVLAVVAIIIVTVLNLYGIKRAGLIEDGLTIVLLIFFIIFLVMLAYFGKPVDPFFAKVNQKTIWSILPALSLIFTSFIGYEDIASIAEEVKNPSKNIPRALILTVIITTTIYFLVALMLTRYVPIYRLAHSQPPVLLAAEIYHLPKILVSMAALFAIISTLIITLLVASRKLYAMAEEGFYKKLLLPLNRFEAPTMPIIICAVLAIAIILTRSLTFIAYLGNSVYLAGVIITTIALIKMRRISPHLHRPFKLPLYPYLAYAIIIASVIIFIMIDIKILFIAGLWIILGFGLHHHSRRLNKARSS